MVGGCFLLNKWRRLVGHLKKKNNFKDWTLKVAKQIDKMHLWEYILDRLGEHSYLLNLFQLQCVFFVSQTNMTSNCTKKSNNPHSMVFIWIFPPFMSYIYLRTHQSIIWKRKVYMYNYKTTKNTNPLKKEEDGQQGAPSVQFNSIIFIIFEGQLLWSPERKQAHVKMKQSEVTQCHTYTRQKDILS